MENIIREHLENDLGLYETDNIVYDKDKDYIFISTYIDLNDEIYKEENTRFLNNLKKYCKNVKILNLKDDKSISLKFKITFIKDGETIIINISPLNTYSSEIIVALRNMFKDFLEKLNLFK